MIENSTKSANQWVVNVLQKQDIIQWISFICKTYLSEKNLCAIKWTLQFYTKCRFAINCTTYWAYWCFLCVFTGDQDEDKVGECPSVRNDTVGICLQNCTYDKECTGNQKCCSNGCGHVCVEPVSKVFKMTFRFNITWDSDYGDENSTKCVALTADILYQVR